MPYDFQVRFCKEGEQLENYTKYQLKASEEIIPFLNGTDNIFVLACNKCFKEFETLHEPDCEAFIQIAKAQGKTVTGSAKLIFCATRTAPPSVLRS